MSWFEQDWILFDCSNGSSRGIQKTPFLIGSGAECHLRISDSEVAERHCVIHRKGQAMLIFPAASGQKLLLNGAESDGEPLAPDDEHTLIIHGRPFLLRGGGNLKKWLEKLDHREWFIYDKLTGSKYGPCGFQDLAIHVPALVKDPADAVVLCRGLSKSGFAAEHVLPYLTVSVRPAAEPLVAAIDGGEFTCPVCWLRFDRGDAMNIASHPSLRGDPILGEEHMQRFQATRFNDAGLAIDAMGLPAPDLACPHCRRKMPPGFLDMPHHIFSIVGAPSAGKSYYLSVLIKMLQGTLYQQFRTSFRDADPSENVLLNQMKTQLFSAATPEDAVLAKTELEGGMYETFPRLGRKVRLPKPFTFHLSNPRDKAQEFCVVFYDNAGEHFEPTRNNLDSPGAAHVAAASGIFFLYDPLHDSVFRRRIGESTDPQLKFRRLDQQDVILAETEVRIRNQLRSEPGQPIATPLAIIVGKSDTWEHLLPGEIRNPIRGGLLDLDIVKANSDLVRAFMLEVCPAIVANADAISSEVSYFAASPLGCSPVEFIDSRGVSMIGPDPQNLKPRHVEIPTLWVLSHIAPGMVPSTRSTY